MSNVIPFRRTNRAFLKAVEQAETPEQLQKLLGEDVNRAEAKVDNMIARFLDRKCSETELRECVEDLSSAELARDNVRKMFGGEGE